MHKLWKLEQKDATFTNGLPHVPVAIYYTVKDSIPIDFLLTNKRLIHLTAQT
jgi:hypothetical protein